jgi:hypothetical protein
MAGCGRPPDQSSGTENFNAAPSDIVGKVIHFNGSQEAEAYKVSGWSGTETSLTWTAGKTAVLALPVPAGSGGVRFRLLAGAYAHPPQLTSQPVEVYANGQKVADWEVTTTVNNFADIPREIAEKNTTLTVQLRIPKAASPAEFSAKGDERVLGLCCTEMELTKLAPR